MLDADAMTDDANMLNTYDLAGKRVLITGAGTGLGAELARACAQRGAVVGICGRRVDRLEGVLTELHEHSPASRSWSIDLADLPRVSGFAANVIDAFGGLDVLINNAGIPKRRPVMALTFDEVEYVNRINYLSPVALTIALLPALIASSGEIINVSSVAARLSPPAEAAYAATKAGITAWSESMRVDFGIADIDVGVHVVNPGVFDTELFSLPGNDPFTAPVEMLTPVEIVEPVLSLLGSHTFEVYVPAWFRDVAAHKFPDSTAYLDGTIAFGRSQR